MKRLPKHLRKEIGRCRSCKALIWWGYRYGRPLPYNVGFEDDGTPYRRNPHKETCPFASDYQPSSRGNLRGVRMHIRRLWSGGKNRVFQISRCGMWIGGGLRYTMCLKSTLFVLP